MFIDNYAFNQRIIFEHKDRCPRYVNILIFLIVGIFILAFLYFTIIEYAIIGVLMKGATQQQLMFWTLFFSIWIGLFFPPLAALNYYYTRFNFYYVVTYDANNFSISSFNNRGEINTEHFSRKITYDFKEKSRFVFMRNLRGYRVGFKYDEKLRKFLEEIQI